MLCECALHTSPQQPAVHQDSMNLVFAKRSKEDVIYLLMVQEIVEAKQNDPHLQTLACDHKLTMQLVENTQVLCKGMAMVLPTALQHRAVSGTTITSNTPVQSDSRKPSVLRCTGKVFAVPSVHLSKTVVSVKLTNITNRTIHFQRIIWDRN